MITRKLAAYFDHGVRSRGQTYFAQRKVTLEEAGADGVVHAVVRGGTLYDVDFDLQRGKSAWSLGAACACPYRHEQGGFCKHIWAALLALDEIRYFHQFGAPPARVNLEPMYDDVMGEVSHGDPFSKSSLERKLSDSLARVVASAPIGGAPIPGVLAKIFPKLYSTGRALVSAHGHAHAPTPARAAMPQPDNLAWLKRLGQADERSYGRPAPREAPAEPVDPIYILEAHEADEKGKFVLSLARQQVTAAGKLGKVKKLSLSAADIPRLRETQDRHIGLMLVGAGMRYDGYGYYGHSMYDATSGHSKWLIPPAVQGALVPLLFASGRFRFRTDPAAEPMPLTWDVGEPWELALVITPANKGGGHAIELQLRRGAERRELDDTDVFIQGEPGLMICDGVLSPVHAHDCFHWISEFRMIGPRAIRKDDVSKMIGTLAGLAKFPPVAWPPEWNVREVDDIVPQPELSLQIAENGAHWNNRSAAGSITFHYDNIATDGRGAGRYLVDTKNTRLIRRQAETEQRLLRRLAELGAKSNRWDTGLQVPEKRLGRLVCSLVVEGWKVLGNKNLYRRPGNFALNVSTGIDWFEVRGGVEFDGQTVALPALLEALRKNEQFVQLGDGSLGMLPEEWLTQHRRWLELGTAENGHVRFTKTQIGLIDALLAEMPEATFDENLAAARQRLQRFAGIQPRLEPAGFVGRLREYQREGLGWLQFLNEFDWGGCLADDMGLGKTVQLLALLADRKRAGDRGPSLVIAPKSLMFNWAREAERFTPELRVLSYTGLERKAQREELGRCDLVLTTYGTLRRDIELLRERDFNYVVLDESQAIKNPDSQSAKAVRLLKGRRRLVMTGTPVENHLGDLWSQFEFLNPGMLGSLPAFRGSIGGGRGAAEDPRTLSLMQRMLRPFILRRTKEQVAPELPGRVEQTITCELGKQQAAYYNELRDHYRASVLDKVDTQGLAKSKMHVLEALLRLRQAACHPGLIDASKKDADSAKLEALLPMIEELIEGGHKALIFSQFTSLLAIVREALDKQGVTYEYLDGQTRQREKCVDRFQNDAACPLFLISLKAGGTGLNLTAADYVFILDPWWNPAVEAQAIDRTHRIGQDKKVIAYRLIAKDTVESKILELQQAKRDLAEAIITEHNSLIRTLTRDDLAALLS